MNRKQLMDLIAADVDEHVNDEIRAYVKQQAEKQANWRNSPDPMVWAEKFVQTFRENPATFDPGDAGLMVGWFANAMAAARHE